MNDYPDDGSDLFHLMGDRNYIEEFGEIIAASLYASGGLESKDILLQRLRETIIDLDVIAPRVTWTQIDIARIRTAVEVLNDLLPEEYRGR